VYKDGNYYDSFDPIISDDVSSINTLSPKSSSSTLKALKRKSEVGTQTETEKINNLDFSNSEYIATKVDQLNALDPFSATP
jgi:hypothetical protein